MKVFGLLIVDKPVGPTSHKIVNMVRQGMDVRKVGHAGTLDPRASGVLVLCLGQATRLSEYISTDSKRYEAVVRFGEATQTYDAEGEITHSSQNIPTREEIEKVLPEFTGSIQQVPPPYSAIKIRGKKAYELARSGEDVNLEPREVTIHRLEVIDYTPPDLVLDIECTAGTYIRSLAHDLGDRLSSGAHLANLRRTKAGPFTLEDAIPLPKLEVGFLTGKWEQYVRPAVDALPDLPRVVISADKMEYVRHGRRIEAAPESTGFACGVDAEGELVAILEAVDEGNAWHPRKVFLG